MFVLTHILEYGNHIYLYYFTAQHKQASFPILSLATRPKAEVPLKPELVSIW